ncbi:MAG: hypothetical protein EBR82_53070 [Caulobacteraceae bacterium]|nr:hypothetical protein [Caulobacteraceae bacterium]
MFELADELYEPKKMVVATIRYAIEVNKDNVFMSEVEDFDSSWQDENDYEDLKRTDAELENAAVSELAEIIYNSIKYNDLADMIEIEITDAV